jgi:hypothetical protein
LKNLFCFVFSPSNLSVAHLCRVKCHCSTCATVDLSVIFFVYFLLFIFCSFFCLNFSNYFFNFFLEKSFLFHFSSSNLSVAHLCRVECHCASLQLLIYVCFFSSTLCYSFLLRELTFNKFTSQFSPSSCILLLE